MDTKEMTPEAANPAPAQQRRVPRQAAPAGKQGTQRPRPAQPQQAAARKTRPVNTASGHSANVQRPVRSSVSRPTAPQGPGMRKSAPQRSSQERSEARSASRPAPARRTVRQNSMQSFISGVRTKVKAAASPEERAERHRRERAERARKQRRREARGETPAVIYTQPQAFSRDKLLMQLLIVTAVVAALVLGMSVFFKVGAITVSGAETYSEWAIREASGISEGDNLLTFSRSRASAQIMAKLAYVDDVRIGIKLPDTVIIYIEEMDVAYAISSSDGDWWLINSQGRVVEQITSAEAGKYTQVLGVTIQDPQVGTEALAAEMVPTETLESGEPVPVTVTGAQRLSAALQILKALEANDIVGDAASVDVTQLQDIVLWYGTRYEVLLGDTNRMEYKIACMNDVILQMSDYQSGILDISFTTWTDQVGYTPFG